MFKLGDGNGGEFAVKFYGQIDEFGRQYRGLVLPVRRTVCNVTCRAEGEEEYDHCGVVTLYSTDKYSKITGKKHALREALLPLNTLQQKHCIMKAERTLIWDAFWEWVQGWGVKCD